MIIQPYTQQYQEAVITLILSIQQGEFQLPVGREDQPDLERIAEEYQQSGGNFWVALQGGTVVGTLALKAAGTGVGALRKMFVAPAFRGKQHGTAQRLLDALFAHARAAGMQHVYLGTTAVYLAAHRFYERNGFVRITREEVPACVPLMAVDTVFYRKAIL
ncbi:GNAT family N-acetyltransferase [Desulfovibrio cuneatus]|uniref:GNAT family N-acetyltransferase n=1 Tax=Desulfovibrio cuneatus TaxID=159728 RepID=UPI0004195520|nr:GNAT family N-acetyltransferase [Desulfovibrio cuneatus]